MSGREGGKEEGRKKGEEEGGSSSTFAPSLLLPQTKTFSEYSWSCCAYGPASEPARGHWTSWTNRLCTRETCLQWLLWTPMQQSGYSDCVVQSGICREQPSHHNHWLAYFTWECWLPLPGWWPWAPFTCPVGQQLVLLCFRGPGSEEC